MPVCLHSSFCNTENLKKTELVTLFGVKMSSIKPVRFRELLVDLVTGDVHTIFGRTKIKLSSRHGFKHLFKELLFKNDS